MTNEMIQQIREQLNSQYSELYSSDLNYFQIRSHFAALIGVCKELTDAVESLQNEVFQVKRDSGCIPLGGNHD